MLTTLFVVSLALAATGQNHPRLEAVEPATQVVDQAVPPAAEAQPEAAAPVSDAANESAGTEPLELDPSELASQRGGQSIVVGNQSLNAVNTGNVLNGDYVAGSVSLSDNAFANFNGLGNLAINTGAQVNLQSGMNVTINIAP